MTKICAVENCKSGTYADQKLRNLNGLSKLHMFKVPKCPQRRKLWENALSQNLDENDRICELHFISNEIDKEDEITIDGKIVKNPKDRVFLKKEAIPRKDVEILQQQQNNSQQNQQLSILPTQTKQQVLSEHEKQQPSSSQQQLLKSQSTEHLVISKKDFEISEQQQHNLKRKQQKLFILQPSKKQRISTEYQQQSFSFQQQPSNCELDEHLTTIQDTLFDVEQSTHCTDIDDASAPQISLEDVKNSLKNSYRDFWCYFPKSTEITLIYFDRITYKERMRLQISNDLCLKSFYFECEKSHCEKYLQTIDELYSYQNEIEKYIWCTGTGFDGQKYSSNCMKRIDNDITQKYQRAFPRCPACSLIRKKLKCNKSLIRVETNQPVLTKKKLKNTQKKFHRLQNKIARLQTKLHNAKNRCAEISQSYLKEQIEKLSDVQKTAVLACFNAARKKSTKGRRYTLEWIYECLLIRMKGTRFYNYLRHRGILPLPSLDTLNKYTQKLNCSAFGFQPALFDAMRHKSKYLKTSERRGVLLADEMKLSEAIAFNQKNMKFNGFVDLGDYTPNEQKNTPGDHALVFMFVPFRGGWKQAISCFITKNSVKSNLLQKLIIECILLLGNAGFHVDAVTMDGAQWNRGVWNLFDINENSRYCEHPFNPNKKLWMLSDFPHLLKCLRNNLIILLQYLTPLGLVKKSHWQAVLDEENYLKLNLKIAYKLTPSHLSPQGYQKMNVPLAYQLFSRTISLAMESLSEKNDKLCDSGPTQKFIILIHNVIQAMTSRRPRDALKLNNDCLHRQAILEFIKFLDEWLALAKTKNFEFPISKSTFTGLKVTLLSTLDLLDTLNAEENFQYLMTANLSQDPLEQFFSIVRYNCGSNDHPEPKAFGQVFRLLSCTSLIRPPRGCNVSGPELLKTLIQTKDSLEVSQQDRMVWLGKIDEIVERQLVAPEDESNHDSFNDEENKENFENDALEDHDYDEAVTSDEVQGYVAGYLVRNLKKSLKCEDCNTSLKDVNNESHHHKLIKLMNLYDGLSFPSKNLFELTQILEQTILKVLGKRELQPDTMGIVLKNIKNKKFPFVGCSHHKKETTVLVINSYLKIRAFFLAKTINKINDAKKMKTKRFRKNAKLY